MDISPRYLPGAAEHLPGVPITFDRYHLVQEINRAVDLVRRSESTRPSTVKRGRDLWLTNPERLSQRQRADLGASLRSTGAPRAPTASSSPSTSFSARGPRTPRPTCAAGTPGPSARALAPIKAFARSIRWHWAGVLRWFTSKMNNGILGHVQPHSSGEAPRPRLPDDENLIAVAYLTVGKLDVASHTE